MITLLERLEGAGLLTREGSERDRRTNVVRLTEEGRRLHRAAQRACTARRTPSCAASPPPTALPSPPRSAASRSPTAAAATGEHDAKQQTGGCRIVRRAGEIEQEPKRLAVVGRSAFACGGRGEPFHGHDETRGLHGRLTVAGPRTQRPPRPTALCPAARPPIGATQRPARSRAGLRVPAGAQGPRRQGFRRRQPETAGDAPSGMRRRPACELLGALGALVRAQRDEPFLEVVVGGHLGQREAVPDEACKSARPVERGAVRHRSRAHPGDAP